MQTNQAQVIGVINKPQFDLNVFEVGVSVRITRKYDNSRLEFQRNGLVCKVTPFSLEILTVIDTHKSTGNRRFSIEDREKQHVASKETITIDSLMSGQDTLEFLYLKRNNGGV